MTIILADQDTTTRGKLKRRLEKIKGIFVVGEAAQPGEATAMIVNRRPDIVILDTELNHGSGIEVLRHIKQHLLNPTIIMVTHHPSEELRDACVAAGADFFFDKSLEDRKVIHTIRLLCAPEQENNQSDPAESLRD
jgi:two-component system, NarL family, response regulator DevR